MLDPVPVPQAKKGDDARITLAKTGSALGEANTRLVKSRKIYSDIRQKYSGQ